MIFYKQFFSFILTHFVSRTVPRLFNTVISGIVLIILIIILQIGIDATTFWLDAEVPHYFSGLFYAPYFFSRVLPISVVFLFALSYIFISSFVVITGKDVVSPHRACLTTFRYGWNIVWTMSISSVFLLGIYISGPLSLFLLPIVWTFAFFLTPYVVLFENKTGLSALFSAFMIIKTYGERAIILIVIYFSTVMLSIVSVYYYLPNMIFGPYHFMFFLLFILVLYISLPFHTIFFLAVYIFKKPVLEVSFPKFSAVLASISLISLVTFITITQAPTVYTIVLNSLQEQNILAETETMDDAHWVINTGYFGKLTVVDDGFVVLSINEDLPSLLFSKLNQQGELIFTKQFAISNSTIINSVTTDENRNILVFSQTRKAEQGDSLQYERPYNWYGTLTKFTNKGELIWSKRLSDYDINSQNNLIFETSQGNYFVAGNTLQEKITTFERSGKNHKNLDGNTQSYLYMMQISRNGEIILQKRISHIESAGDNKLLDAYPTSDNGFLFVSNYNTGVIITKVNSRFETVSSKDITDLNASSLTPKTDDTFSLYATNLKEKTLSVYTISSLSNANNEIFIQKEKNIHVQNGNIIDSTVTQNGDQLFLFQETTYGESVIDTLVNYYNPFIKQYPNLGIYPNISRQSYLLKISSDGKTIWSNRLKDYTGRPDNIIHKRDGGYVVSTSDMSSGKLVIVSTNKEGIVPGCSYSNPSIPFTTTDIQQSYYNPKEVYLESHPSSFELEDSVIKEVTGLVETLDIEYICK
jgi:hypothetical protein